jgi:hypothetical protein
MYQQSVEHPPERTQRTQSTQRRRTTTRTTRRRWTAERTTSKCPCKPTFEPRCKTYGQFTTNLQWQQEVCQRLYRSGQMICLPQHQCSWLQLIHQMSSLHPYPPPGPQHSRMGQDDQSMGQPVRSTADLPDYICKNFSRLLEEPRLTGAFWKTEAAQSETSYFTTIKNTSNQFREVRVEYIYSNTQASWFILVKKQVTWIMHEELCLGKGWNGLGHKDHKPATVEHRWQKSEEPSETMPTPGTSTQPYKEFLSGGLHHVAMLLGSYPLTPKPSAPILVQAIEQAAIKGQHIPLN